MRCLPFLLVPAALLAQAPTSPQEQMVDTAMAFAKAQAAAFGGEHQFKVAQPPRVPMTRPGTLTFEASHLSKHEPMGRFFVVLTVKVDGDRVGMARVDMDGSWVGTVLRAKADLPRKTELSAEQVDPSPFEGVPPEGALTELPAGQRLMRSVPSGRILTRGDLEVIPLVQSGDKVTLTSTHDALTVRVDTIARSRAGLGERVRLEPPGARRQVTAIVTGPGEARLP